MIDVHCHLLPGLDHGAKDLDSSLRLGRQLCQAGFRKVIATPHVLEGREFLDPRIIREATARFNLELEREGIPLKVLPGAEYYIFPELPRYLKEEKVLTLADSHKYLLLELPQQELPIYTEQVIFKLQVQGIVPVLAHPERCSYFTKAAELLVEWKNKGVLLQVDLRSLEGLFGPGPLKLADWLLDNGLAQVVGTDAHGPSHQEERYQKILRSFSQRVGPQHCKRYLEIYPEAIVKGEKLENFDDERLIIPFRSKRRGEKGRSFDSRVIKKMLGINGTRQA